MCRYSDRNWRCPITLHTAYASRRRSYRAICPYHKFPVTNSHHAGTFPTASNSFSSTAYRARTSFEGAVSCNDIDRATDCFSHPSIYLDLCRSDRSVCILGTQSRMLHTNWKNTTNTVQQDAQAIDRRKKVSRKKTPPYSNNKINFHSEPFSALCNCS